MNALEYNSLETVHTWTGKAHSILPVAPSLRLASETSAEDIFRYQIERSREVWNEIVDIVRQALYSKDSYRDVWLSRREVFIALLQEYRSLPVTPNSAENAPERKSVMTQKIQEVLGSEWSHTMDDSRSLLEEARKVMGEPVFRVPSNKYSAEKILQNDFNESLYRIIFGELAIQIISNEDVPRHHLDDIYDDMIYLPRTMYVVICEGLRLHGGVSFYWLKMVYELDAWGRHRDALGLLLEGMARVSPKRIPDLLATAVLDRMSTLTIRGLITVATPHKDKNRDVRRFVRHAEDLLQERYSRA